MSGEYVMMEFAGWTIKEITSLFNKNDGMRVKAGAGLGGHWACDFFCQRSPNVRMAT
jgi:hypothetical protein